MLVKNALSICALVGITGALYLFGIESSPGPLALSLIYTSLGLVIIGVLLFLWGFSVSDTIRHEPHGLPILGSLPRGGTTAVCSLWVVSCLLYPIDSAHFYSFVVWIVTLATACAVILPRALKGSSKIRVAEGVLLCIVLILAGSLRIWSLPDLPFRIDGDVFSLGLAVREIFSGAETDWIGGGWGNLPMPYIRFWALLVGIFGDSYDGLMRSFVFVGLFGVAACWVLGRTIGGPTVGILSAALAAGSFYHIHFSRSLYIEPASIVTALSISSFIGWIKKRNDSLLMLSGIFAGLGLVVYESARITLLVISSGVVAALLKREISFKEKRNGILVFVISILIAWGPNVIFAIENFFEFKGRASEVTLLNEGVRTHLYGKYGVTSFPELIREQVLRSYGGFIFVSDASPHARFDRPLLDSPLHSALFLMGCTLLFIGARREDYQMLLSWIILVPLFGGVLTNDPPYSPHLVVALPAVFTAIALAIRSLVKLSPSSLFLSALLVVFMTINSWSLYVQKASLDSDEFMIVGRYLQKLSPNTEVLLIGDYEWEERQFVYLSSHLKGRSFPLWQLGEADLSDAEVVITREGDLATVRDGLEKRGKRIKSTEIIPSPAQEIGKREIALRF